MQTRGDVQEYSASEKVWESKGIGGFGWEEIRAYHVVKERNRAGVATKAQDLGRSSTEDMCRKWKQMHASDKRVQ